jgi:23S rRNA (guanosine2251-2'-O)-methyltransferase
MNPPIALVVGSEGSGLRRLVRETCDMVVSIPMFGNVESLNAATAGSIALYEIVRDAEPVAAIE